MEGPEEISIQILKEGHKSLIQTSAKELVKSQTHDSRHIKDQDPFKICS